MAGRQLELFSPAPEAGGHGRRRPPAAAPLPVPVPPGAPPARPAVLPAGTRWREIALDARILGFLLRRSRRKSIGLVIRDDGLLVQAPAWSTLPQIDHVVREKADWILRKLDERDQRLRLLALQATQWRAGGAIPYLGVRIELALDGTRAARYAGDADTPRTGDTLSLPLPADAGPDRVRDSAGAWLQQRARIDFGRRLDRYLAAAGMSLKDWRLSSATGRWGSCNSDRRILLNWRLIHFEPRLIDYVVAHEVTHLRVMNHSPAFWRELGRLYPEFKQARDTLAQHHPDSLPLI